MRVVMCGGCTSHHPYTQVELDRILNLLNVSNQTFIEPYVPGTEWDRSPRHTSSSPYRLPTQDFSVKHRYPTSTSQQQPSQPLGMEPNTLRGLLGLSEKSKFQNCTKRKMKLYTHTNTEKNLERISSRERERDWTWWRIYNFIPFCAAEMLCQRAWVTLPKSTEF